RARVGAPARLVGGGRPLAGLPQARIATTDVVQVRLALGRAGLLQRGGEHLFLIHRTDPQAHEVVVRPLDSGATPEPRRRLRLEYQKNDEGGVNILAVAIRASRMAFTPQSPY